MIGRKPRQVGIDEPQDVSPRQDRRLSNGVRRSQEERTSETRSRLLDAAIAVLLERGYDGLSMAEVGLRAGVSNGARVHHFRAKADLVIAAAARTYAHSAQLSRIRAKAALSTKEPLLPFIEFCLDHYFDWPFRASNEIVNTAHTDPALMADIAPILGSFHDDLEADWCKVLRASGYSSEMAERQFRMTLTHIRGLALTSLWRDSEDRSRRQTIREWLCYLEARDGRPRIIGSEFS